MFKKQDFEKGSAETIIGSSVKIEGDFVGKGNVIVEGVVNGSLSTDQNLTIAEGAKVLANIKAQNALISGEVQGNILIKEGLELGSTARIFGDINTQQLTIATGAIFNGKCNMGNTEKIKQTTEK